MAIRVLVADDESAVRDMYREVLIDADMNGETAMFRDLRSRLFTQETSQRVAQVIRVSDDCEISRSIG